MLCLDVFCASLSKVSEVSEKPNRGYFGRLRTLRNFSCKLVVIASSLDEGFHRNSLLPDSRGNLCLVASVIPHTRLSGSFFQVVLFVVVVHFF